MSEDSSMGATMVDLSAHLENVAADPGKERRPKKLCSHVAKFYKVQREDARGPWRLYGLRDRCESGWRSTVRPG